MRAASLLACHRVLLNSSRSLACVIASTVSQSLPRFFSGSYSSRTIVVAGGVSSSMGSTDKGSVSREEYDRQWHDTWQSGLSQGQKFDAGRCSPLLSHLLSSGQLQVDGKKTMVPGCGRGYDVFAFAQAGAVLSTGLDLSPEAVAAAQSEQQVALADHPAASAAVHLTAGDFFSHGSSPDFKGPYDVGYDYTFLCALHPDMRHDWARGWSHIIAPGGELVTLMFPVGGTPEGAPKNPPWPVTPELYKDLLLPAGFEPIVVEPVAEHLSHKPRAGREWLGRWRRIAGAAAAPSSSSL